MRHKVGRQAKNGKRNCNLGADVYRGPLIIGMTGSNVQNPDSFGTTLQKIEISIIQDLLHYYRWNVLLILVLRIDSNQGRDNRGSPVLALFFLEKALNYCFYFHRLPFYYIQYQTIFLFLAPTYLWHYFSIFSISTPFEIFCFSKTKLAYLLDLIWGHHTYLPPVI